MADSDNKIITIGEAKELMPGCFPSASGDELKRCPTKSELIANGFSVNETTRTYENNQTVVSGDISGYDVRYSISNERIVYSSGTKINASGSNYATIKATVTKYIGTYPQEVLENVTLTPVFNAGDSNIYVSGTSIKASNRTTDAGDERSASFKGTYATATSVLLAVYQEANRIENSNYLPKDYYVDISIQQGVHAGGGSSNVNRTAYHYAKNLYTSGSSDDFSRRNDTPVITEVSDPNNRFNYNSSTGMLEHSSMGTYSGTDTCTLRATNNTATKDATISVTNNYSDSWNDPVVSTFAYASTIPASGGTAMPSVTATQSGTRTWGSGSSDPLQNNVFQYTYSMSSSGRWSLKSPVTGEVSATTRGTVTGNTETSPTVTVTVSAYDKSGTSTATASQQTNTATYHTSGETWSPTNILNCTSDGGNYFAVGPYEYYDWYHYTSGADSIPARHTTVATATSYTNLISWISIVSSPSYMIHLASNPTESGRSHTLTATYNGISKQVEVSQYRAPYSTYEYRIASWNTTKDTWTASQSGTSVYATVTADCEYRTVTWKDGSTTTGSWTDYNTNTSPPSTVYNNRPMLISPQHFGFYKYDGTVQTGGAVDMYYPDRYTNYGSMRVYPLTANAGVADINVNLTLSFGTASTTTTFTHSGDGSFTIRPTSLSFASAASSATITVTTYLTGWTVSDNAGWVSTSVNGNVVTVTVTENTSTTTSRSATVSFTQGGRTVGSCSVSQTAKPVPPTPTGTTVYGITKIYELGDGWIVGKYQNGHGTTPCNYDIYTLVLARNDRGVNTTFLFDIDEAHVSNPSELTHGYYAQHMCGNNSKKTWFNATADTTSTYTGQTINITNYQGETINCYGFSIGGGPEAETLQAYAGISII